MDIGKQKSQHFSGDWAEFIENDEHVEKSGFLTLIIQIVMIILILFFLYKLLFDSNTNKKYYRKNYKRR